ncbi:MAG TPA: hypothetical protein VFE65_36205 [Pseudonocardia sp.]|nr:hypothetical protein [Pseudonocardia sp.]
MEDVEILRVIADLFSEPDAGLVELKHIAQRTGLDDSEIREAVKSLGRQRWIRHTSVASFGGYDDGESGPVIYDRRYGRPRYTPPMQLGPVTDITPLGHAKLAEACR